MGNVLVTLDTDKKLKEIMNERIGSSASIYYMKEMDDKQLEKIPSKIEIILCMGLSELKNSLVAMKSLKLIQTILAGANHLPYDTIPRDVMVCTTHGANSRAIAEHCFSLLLSCAKNIVRHTMNMRQGIFHQNIESKELEGSVIGIVGFGSIGREIAKLARAFGMRIFATNTSGRTDEDVEYVGTLKDLDHVLRNSDFLAFSIPLSKRTRNLITKKELDMMKKDAVLVNIARGKIINMRDMFHHLKAHPEFQAAFDVWWSYPKPGEKFGLEFPFETLPNLVMTPHIASNVPQWEERAVVVALENIARYSRGEKLLHLVDKTDYLDLEE